MNLSQLLYEYVFGALDEEHTALIEHALETSTQLRGELAELRDVAAAIGRGRPLLVPPPSSRDRCGNRRNTS